MLVVRFTPFDPKRTFNDHIRKRQGADIVKSYREEFRTLASVRKSPKNEPAVQGMSYGDLRFEAASGGGVLTASSVVKAGL